MDNIVTINPAAWKEIITEVMAPGPASKGNASGTTPVSPGTVPPNLHKSVILLIR
jgi:hypothetical protein